MASIPGRYNFPSIFRRLSNQKQAKVEHFIKLRETKAYRNQQGRVLVQGLKTIRELRNEGFEFDSLVVTATKEPYSESEIKYPALQVIQNPDAIPAKEYYLVDVDLTRRILGTASRPGCHELFAEVRIPKATIPEKAENDRMLIFDHVNDPGNLGNLVRTAKALGWNAGVTTTGTCDMFNDKTLRASRSLSLKWPFRLVPVSDLVGFLRYYNMTPVVADMLPRDPKHRKDLWSPATGPTKNGEMPEIGSGLWFWNFKNKRVEVPKRIALVLSSEHNGAQGLDNELRVSIPMAEGVESINVASAGSILLHEINRLLPLQSKNKDMDSAKEAIEQ